MKKIWNLLIKLIKKHKAFIAYGVFGVFTTIVNIVTYNVCYSHLGISNTLSNIFAWILAVTFAYLTNKVWVFGSRSWAWSTLKREIAAFAGCRIATGVMDLVIMFICVDIMEWNALLMKLLSNILVIILNYVFSKLVIFKKK